MWTAEKQLLVFEMAEHSKILGIHTMEKIKQENIRVALNLTDTIVHKVCIRDNINDSDMQCKWMKIELKTLERYK